MSLGSSMSDQMVLSLNFKWLNMQRENGTEHQEKYLMPKKKL
jgi:hypothetical protein